MRIRASCAEIVNLKAVDASARVIEANDPVWSVPSSLCMYSPRATEQQRRDDGRVANEAAKKIKHADVPVIQFVADDALLGLLGLR